MTRLQENLEKLKVQGSEDDSEEKVDSPFDQKFRNFQNEIEWYGNFQEKFAKILETVEFPKCQSFNGKFRKFRQQNRTVVRCPGRNFRKFGYRLARLSSFSEISGGNGKWCSIHH